jgi:hypothetical protein
MEAPRKPKSPLQRVPTRKLVAGIKKDLRQMIRNLERKNLGKSKKSNG